MEVRFLSGVREKKNKQEYCREYRYRNPAGGDTLCGNDRIALVFHQVCTGPGGRSGDGPGSFAVFPGQVIHGRLGGGLPGKKNCPCQPCRNRKAEYMKRYNKGGSSNGRASALRAEDEGSIPSPPTVVVAELEALPYSAGL